MLVELLPHMPFLKMGDTRKYTIKIAEIPMHI
jgi:hypothetical protein